jgi:hypothetical protein
VCLALCPIPVKLREDICGDIMCAVCTRRPASRKSSRPLSPRPRPLSSAPPLDGAIDTL